MKKNITVLIPTFNRSKLLERNLSSLYDQDADINIDCIISDNCSNDDTEELVKSITKPKSNVKITYIKQSNPLSPLDNWKYLISYIDNEYAKYLFDDDWLEVNALKTMMKDLHRLDASSIIYNTNIYAKNNDYEPIIEYYKYQDTELNSNLLIDSTLRVKNVLPVSPSAAIQKSNLLSEALLFSEINKTCSDSVIGNDFTMNFYPVFKGENCFFRNKNIINLWGGDDSITMVNKNEKVFSFCYIKSLVYLIEKYDTLYSKDQGKLIRHKIFANNLRANFNSEYHKFYDSNKFKPSISIVELNKYLLKTIGSSK